MSRGKLPPEFLAKLKEAVNIVDVVGEHVVLRKSGSNYSGLCPFHSERSPSFSVSEQKQLYHCYGCKKGGDLLGFVMDIHGLGFMEAIEELSERAKIPLPKDYGGGDSKEDPETRKRREAAREKLATAYKLNRFVAAFYHHQLGKLPHVEKYFRARAVHGDLAREFYVGAAAPSWDALSRHLEAKKAPLPLAVELGLVRPSTKKTSSGSGYFDLFRNRAMFPILDMRGRVAGFGGRLLATPEGAPEVNAASGEGAKSPKYMNSPESFIYHKGKLAFGLYQAQKHVREKDEIVLVEGYFDVTALHAAGFRNVVAISGTALTADHLHAFRRLGSRITLLLDGDKAGISATERAMELGLEQGMVLYGATMPEGFDPDELLFDQETGKPTPDGVERMKGILGGAQPLRDARSDEAVAHAQAGPEARVQAVKRVSAWLQKFKDPVGREVRLQTLQERLGVGRQLLGGSGPSPGPGPGPARPQPNAHSQPPQQNRRPPRTAGGAKSEALSPREQLLLTALAKGGRYTEILADARRNLPVPMTLADLFDYGPARAFTQRLATEPGLLERFRAAPEQVLVELEDMQVRSILTEALLGEGGTSGVKAPPLDDPDLRRALGKSVIRAWDRFLHQAKSRLQGTEAKEDAGLHQRLSKEFLDGQRKKEEVSKLYDEE